MPVRSAEQPAGWREAADASHHKTISSSTAVFLLSLGKKCYTRYSLLNVLIMSFLIPALNFILIDGAHISWNILNFHSKSWNKAFNYCYLVYSCGSSTANFYFHYHWNLFKDIKSLTCKPKTNIPPWAVILLKQNKLMKHQVNLTQKQFKIKRISLFSISISFSSS